MKFSLITVTMGDRPAELRRLKDSLASQTYRDFEHIIIDQREHPETKGGLSAARNIGLKQATGDIIAFPDDDCWYAADTLSDVVSIINGRNIDGISLRITDDKGQCSAGGYMDTNREKIIRSNVWQTAVSCSFFVNRKIISNLQFDENLGVGSCHRFGSGEETDFILNLLNQGANIEYYGDKTIFHPQFNGKWSIKRGWLYGNGCGYVLKKHKFSIFRLFWMMLLQLVRAGQSILTLKFSKSCFHIAMSVGRFCGYFFAKNSKNGCYDKMAI